MMKFFLARVFSSMHVRAGFLFLILGFSVFFNGLHNDFMMDDYAVIFSDQLQDEPQNFWKHFLPQYQHGMSESHDSKYAYFRPWAHAPMVISYHFFNHNPFYYHLFNLLLFLLAVWSIYSFVYYLFGHWLLSFLTAVFFLVHPMNGLLVNYITAYVFSLQMIFIFWGLILAVKSFDHKNKTVLVMALVCHLNALLCHETAFAFPVYLTLALWFFRPAKFLQIFRFTLFFWFLDIVYFIFRMFYASLKSFLLDNASLMYLSWGDCSAIFVKLVVWYVQALVTLQKIVLIKVETSPVFWGWYVAAGALVVAVIVILVAAVKKKHIAIFAILWLAAGFIPLVPAVFFQYQFGLMLEPHWLMVSSMGYYLLVAWLFVRLLDVWPKVLVFLILGIFISFCVVQTLSNNRLWGKEADYCAAWLKESPSLKLILMLQANGFVYKKQYASAKKVYLKAAESICDDPDLYYKLALVEGSSEKNLEKVKEYLLRALSIDFDSGDALHELGVVYEKLDKDYKTAEDMFKRALFYAPNLDEARESLVRVYLKQERFSDAWDFLNEQRKMYPLKTGLYVGSIRLALKTSRFELLPTFVDEYIDLEKRADLMLRMAVLLSKQDQNVLALKCFKRVLELDPDFKNGYLDAGQFLASINRFDGAIAVWQEGQRRYSGEPKFVELINRVRKLKENIPGQYIGR